MDSLLVSALMPTRGRGEWAARALSCFRAQTYENKELIIVDDADDPSFRNATPGIWYPKNVRYIRNSKRFTIPEKRNQACAAANGEILIHFDSDDWSDPSRMAHQVLMLQKSSSQVCGYSSLLFWDESQKQAWRYSGRQDYALGTSLCFTKEWWRKHPFNAKHRTGSDNVFVKQAEKSLTTAPGNRFIVARSHKGNSSPRHYGLHWKKIDKAEIPEAFFA